ncbi:potassium channel family protein [Halalkalicoccus jeotgali]|uniref:TrkA-N domain protein n=1 Tax=Halalkalicoccus jeotgali (strain DSM 18796 / CECT 7217 / JCM 14584 / KCTC 4019 / B3) TaxID=795797 RepID=D8JBG5_HALJB|nr:NAD-binding protein [Halalkalicoccus jeotgali]ADJ16618.1 TrkA-N domain protein [Halalkalicoccus jeotgali B3]ELY41285.1 TrkA-N domain-containing protein [Halalkalicoccus jeotgali B3]
MDGIDSTELGNRWQRRTIYYALVLVLIIIAYAVLYHTGMVALEGEDVTFLHSLQVVVETFTTTGYGSDAPWDHPWMNVLVIVMDLTGVGLIFLALPLLLFPLFEEAISTTPPVELENDLADHVIICAFSPRTEVLINELVARDVDYVIVESDTDRATRLHEDGHPVINRNAESVEGLRAAQLSTARALIVDVDDETNTSIILTAKEVAGNVQVISTVEDPEREHYHQLAGADTVLTPRLLLGQSLAAKVTSGISAELSNVIEITEDFELAELPVQRDSDLVGRTIADSRIREQTGVNLLGAWSRGWFESPPSPTMTIDESTVLLAAGREEQLQRLKERTRSTLRPPTAGETILVGYGETGRAIGEVLHERGVTYTVLDALDMPDVDVVGDATKPENVLEAGISNARTVVLALPEDATTEVTTLVSRDLNPAVEIVARAEQMENVTKIYRAGADYVLSLATVSGRMLATTVIEDEEVISLNTQIEVVRTPASRLAGQRLEDTRIRSRTGCTVVGVERTGDVITDLGPEFRIEADDLLIVAGTDEGVNQFTEILE